RLLGQYRLDVRLLARRVEAGIGLRDDLYAEALELVVGAVVDGIGVLAHLMPDESGGKLAGLDLIFLLRRQRQAGGGCRRFAMRSGRRTVGGESSRSHRQASQRDKAL